MRKLTLSLLALCLSMTMLHAQWEKPSGITADKIHSIAMDPDAPGTVYAATERGVFVTKDNGESWAMMNDGLKYNDVWSIAEKNGLLLAGSWEPGSLLPRKISDPLPRGDVSLSVDGGKNWNSLKNGLTARGVSALAPCSSGFLAATYDDGIFRTTDTGATWTLVSPKKSFYHLTSAPCGLFAVSHHDAYRSQDDGQTWQRMDLGKKCSFISCIACTGSAIYVAADSVIETHHSGMITGEEAISVLLRSTDAGGHWSTLQIPKMPRLHGIYAFGDTLIALFFSSDPSQGGFTSHSLERSGPLVVVPDGIALREADPPAGSGEEAVSDTAEGPAGIHVSIDGGRTWTVVNEGLPVTHSSVLTVRDGYVFAGPHIAGLFRRPWSELVASVKAGRK
jgi:hypothetical protein